MKTRKHVFMQRRACVAKRTVKSSQNAFAGCGASAPPAVSMRAPTLRATCPANADRFF
jgi:hypothetical protein